MKKKGSIQTLAPMIMILVFAAIILVMGIIISQGVVNTIEDVSVSIANESHTATCLNGTGCYLDTYAVCNFNTPSITGIINASNGAVFLTGNATVNSTGFVTNASTALTHATNISYTYNWGDEACMAGESTVEGLGTFADFWEIIVLAIVITIVLGLLLVIFGGRRPR